MKPESTQSEATTQEFEVPRCVKHCAHGMLWMKNGRCMQVERDAGGSLVYCSHRCEASAPVTQSGCRECGEIKFHCTESEHLCPFVPTALTGRKSPVLDSQRAPAAEVSAEKHKFERSYGVTNSNRICRTRLASNHYQGCGLPPSADIHQVTAPATHDENDTAEDRPYRWTIEPHPNSSFTHFITDSDDEAREALIELWDAMGSDELVITIQLNKTVPRTATKPEPVPAPPVGDEVVAEPVTLSSGCKLGEPLMHGPRPYRWCEPHDRLMLTCDMKFRRPPPHKAAPALAPPVTHGVFIDGKGRTSCPNCGTRLTIKMKGDSWCQ